MERMNDPFDTLKDWQIPAPSAQAQRRALEESLGALRTGKSPQKATPRFAVSSTVAFGFAAALSLLFSVVMLKSFHRSAKPEPVPLTAGTLAQFDTLFGLSLNALIECDGRLEVETAVTPNSSRGQPVLVTAETRSGSVQIVSFSGSAFELIVGDERLRIEPLIAVDGTVLLCGEQFVWGKHSTSHSLPPPLKTLQAVPLPPAT